MEHPAVYIDVLDPERNTPLHFACFEGHVAVVKTLLMYGASPRVKNAQLRSPGDLAGERRHIDVTKAILASEFRNFA